ncbi:MAG: GNAT family N-acetyltransferase [Lachnospiraceae bacterium]|nr:GNAT family N-acetyltransferase [Lachnospiraceae bacterium]
MIRYLEDNEKGISEALYREAFPEDKDAFVEYYYSYVTKNNRILVMEQAEKVCSMLHLNPYRLSVNGTEVDAYYYVAVATREDCRHQGMMRKLLHKSLNDIHEEGHPFTYLMPANRAIYEPFDFRIVYQQKKVELPLDPQKANERMAEMFDVYTLRDDWYVEKMLEEERVCAGDPPFEIVPYIMTRITHVEKMLGLLSSEKSLNVVLNVEDKIIPENQGTFLWEISTSESFCRKLTETENGMRDKYTNDILQISTNIEELTEFVFGKRKIEGLGDVKVLDRICINEAV